MITIVERRDLIGRAQRKDLREIVQEDVAKSRLFGEQSNILAVTDGEFFRVLKGYNNRDGRVISKSEFYSLIGEEIKRRELVD